MKKKNLIKTIKNWLAFAITIILVVVLFGIIFVKLGLASPGPSFYLELSIIVGLSLTMRIFWYDFAEDKRLSEDDIKEAKDKYYNILDTTVSDSNDLEKYLILLNDENKKHYVDNKLGSRTPQKLAKKTKWMCFWHPRYRKLSAEAIGEIRFEKLKYKYSRKADKLHKITSEELMALSESEVLYDSKNYAKQKKRGYQVASTILSTIFTILIAMIAFKDIMLNWENAFKYMIYLFSIVSTIGITVIRAYKSTGEETFDWLNRLKFILDKYDAYKKKEEVKKDD